MDAGTTRLEPLREIAEPIGIWSEDRWIGRSSTLWDGDRPLGHFRLLGWSGKNGVLETAAGTWRVQRSVWKGRWIAEPEARARGRLVYEPGPLGRKPMTIESGAELSFRMRNLWRGVWAWCRGDDEVVRFERRRQFPRATFEVRWDRDVRHWPELDPLIGLGWWMLLERRSHGSGAGLS